MEKEHRSIEEIINTHKPVLIEFFADGLVPSEIMERVLEEINKALGDRAIIIRINIDKNGPLVNYFKINEVPTLMIFKDQELKWRKSGIISTWTLLDVLKEYVNDDFQI